MKHVSEISHIRKDKKIKAPVDGGNCPIFHSYHDYYLKHNQLKERSRHKDAKAAFEDFKRALDKDRDWRKRFSPEQVHAIEIARNSTKPTIDKFTWHHHQDRTGELMQLVDRAIHVATHHSGGWCISQQELD
jgi:hypothetical protein